MATRAAGLRCSPRLAGSPTPLRAAARPGRAPKAPLRLLKAPVAAARSEARSEGGRRQPAASGGTAAGGGGWRTFWTAVDASAWLGTVGAAVAFVLTQEAVLAGAPVVLPLLALYASRQRERLAVEAEQQRQLSRLEELLLEMQVLGLGRGVGLQRGRWGGSTRGCACGASLCR